MNTLSFPTPLHEQAAETVYRFAAEQPGVDTVLVVNSLARGQGIPESDLDMNVLVLPEVPQEEVSRLEVVWRQALLATETLRRYRASGPNAFLHLDIVRGEFVPEVWDEGGGPDYFEVGIGNLVAYGAPLHGAGPYYKALQALWLPYYDETLRAQRLGMVREACLRDLDYVAFFARRGLYFQAFASLFDAFQEFLQALFIAHRVYPLSYTKWVRMQVVEWLGLPELYTALPRILSVSDLESDQTAARARELKALLEQWV